MAVVSALPLPTRSTLCRGGAATTAIVLTVAPSECRGKQVRNLKIRGGPGIRPPPAPLARRGTARQLTPPRSSAGLSRVNV